MSFFPLYLDMNPIKVLLVGGGCIASEKLEKLLDFSQEITVISNEVNAKTGALIEDHALTLHLRAYQKGDLNGFDMVVIATDTIALHKEIYEASRNARIWVNSVDNLEYCDFIFPSYIQKGDLTIAISTGGASPSFSKRLRQYFENNIPDSVEVFLNKMKSLRKSIPKGKERMEHFDALVKIYFEKEFK